MKYNGLCAYTGKPLGDDWQIDHVIPKKYVNHKNEINTFENLMPSLKIINHYKRSLDLEKFRRYIATLQKRIDKLPKWIIKNYYPTSNYNFKMSDKRKKIFNRAKYIIKVAELFGITPENPFNGKFYFENVELTNK
ncbi:MAG: HNH endonuclease [Fibromonadaceae bacterium]|jgi:hypothetical protein|nr:HNH endonuclease [Fibromonadaceae bacterium]